MNLLVFGWYDNCNAGDESYKISFPAMFPNHNFTFSNNLNDDLVKKCDAIILGGGNILDQKFISEIKKYYKIKPLYALSVGSSNFNLNRSDLEIFDKIIVRDHETKSFLDDLGIKSTLAPDLAFILSPNKQNGRKLLDKILKEEGVWSAPKTIVIVINTYLSRGGQNSSAKDEFRFQTFCHDMADIIDRTESNFIFLQFGQLLPWSDSITNGMVLHRCSKQQKNAIVYQRLSSQEIIDIISVSDAMVSTRYHSTLFSIIAGTPFLDIYHTNKNKVFLDSIDFGEKECYWSYSKENIFNKLNKMLYEKEDYSALFKQNLIENYKNLF